MSTFDRVFGLASALAGVSSAAVSAASGASSESILIYTLAATGATAAIPLARWAWRRLWAWIVRADYALRVERTDSEAMRLRLHELELEASAEKAKRTECRGCFEALRRRAELAEEQRDQLARRIAGLEEEGSR